MKRELLLVAGTCSIAVIWLMGRIRKSPVLQTKSEELKILPDYDTYVLNRKEWLRAVVMAGLFLAGLAYVFYQSITAAVLLFPLALFYPRLKSGELMQKRKTELNRQFRDALYVLSAALGAGKSIESAIHDVCRDLELIYPEQDAYIIREFSEMSRQIKMNETIEKVLSGFAERAHLEDVTNFVDVFSAGKRSGGNLLEIMRNTSLVIGDKIRIREEIDTLLAQRRLEYKILCAMPVILILVLTWTTGDYMSAVYDTGAGRIVMTVAAVLLAVAYFLAGKIMDIEV